MPEQVVFEDGFPCDPASPNFAAHDEMTSDLTNCAALWSTGAPAGLLFPKCCSQIQRPDWVAAAAERLDWHMRNAQGSWVNCLRALLRLLIGHDTVLDEKSLLLLATWGRHLQDNRGNHECYNLVGAIARTIEKHKSIEKPLAEALCTFTDHLVLVHCHQPATFEIAYRLYCEGWIKIEWAEEFRQAKYALLLKQANHSWQAPTVYPKEVAAIAKAVTKIGSPEVSAVISRVAEKMEAQQPLQLSGGSMTVLRQVLRWVQAGPELAVDEALHRICALKWREDKYVELLMREWVPTLLAAIAARPKDRVFACVEQLAHNPQTKDLPGVLSLYTQSMSEVVGDVSAPHQTDAERNLDAYLQAGNVDLAVRQASADVPAMLRAMNARVKRSQKGSRERLGLTSLYAAILRKTEPKLTAIELEELCEIDGELMALTGPVLTLCEEHIDRNGLEPRLSRAMRAWAQTVHGGASAQAQRKAIDWLLWFDTEVPVDAKTCWSSVIHADLRAMSPDKRGPWIALLRNVTFAIAEEPTKKWLKPAPKLLAAIDPEDFRSRLLTWFKPFESGQPLKLSVAGRDILQALFWYAQLAKDPQIDAVLPSFGSAKWKAKGDRDKTARLLPVWIHTMRERCPDQAVEAIQAYQATGQLDLTGKSLEIYNELCRREGRAPEIEAPPPPPAFDKEVFLQQQLGRMMTAIGGPGVQVEQDMVEVADPAGVRYQINMRDGRILRLSDNRVVRLEIDFSQPPFSPFKHIFDSMDMMQPYKPNYARTMMLAQMLSGQLMMKAPIVVDEGDHID